MGISDRKQREKEEMRLRILEAARDIFIEKGYDQASMRNIADKIEYSPGTIYLYFKEKDDIFRELHNQGFFMLLEKMQGAGSIEDPFERLKEMGRLYMEFAFTNKDFYDLMFIMKTPLKLSANEPWEMGCRAFAYLEEVVQESIDRGYFPNRNVHFLAFTLWAGLHGMCALYCRDRMQVMGDIEPETILDNSFKYFIDMLERM